MSIYIIGLSLNFINYLLYMNAEKYVDTVREEIDDFQTGNSCVQGN